MLCIGKVSLQFISTQFLSVIIILFFCYNKRQHKRLLSHHRSKVQPERRFGTIYLCPFYPRVYNHDRACHFPAPETLRFLLGILPKK